MNTTTRTCDHTRLIHEGGTMYRATDNRGRETEVCDCCHWQPGQTTEKRDRNDSADVLTAAALGPVTPTTNPTTVPIRDVLADLDATPPAHRDPTAALAAIAATQQPYQAGIASVSLDVGYGYPSPKGQWATIKQAVDACMDQADGLKGFDCWLLVYRANGTLEQQIYLEDLLTPA